MIHVILFGIDYAEDIKGLVAEDIIRESRMTRRDSYGAGLGYGRKLAEYVARKEKRRGAMKALVVGAAAALAAVAVACGGPEENWKWAGWLFYGGAAVVVVVAVLAVYKLAQLIEDQDEEDTE